MRKSMALAAVWLASGAYVGCAWDISKLTEPPRDGEAPMDVAPVDTGVDTGVDAGPRRVCVSLLDPMQGRVIGGSLIYTGSTIMGTHLADPPASCNAMSRGAPEIYFDYQVQRGGTVVASTEVATEGATCPLASDTVAVIHRGSCDLPGMPIACNDDAEDLSKCFDSGARAVATGLAVGDRLMIAVDGYLANAGPFTLTVVENPLTEVPPSGSRSILCACPTSAPTTTPEDVPLTMAGDSAMGAQASGRLETAGQFIGGPRTLMGTAIKGIAGVIGLTTNDFATRAECRTRSATFDVMVGAAAARAFTIDSNTSITRTARLMFRSSTDITFTAGSRVRIALRSTVMPTMGAPCGVGFSPASTLTFLTAR
jgi:hypothetical protein